MKLSYKALIYSGVVFPGSGYFILGKKIKGTVSMLFCIGAFSLLMIEAFYGHVDEVQDHSFPFD